MLDIFHLAKLISFDAARRIPMLRQMSQGRVREVVSRSVHETSYHQGCILHVVRLFCIHRATKLYPQVRF